jgi:hypothetical protein
MKKYHLYEAIAVVLALPGVILLVNGLMPFINPGFVEVNHTRDYSPRTEFLIPTLLSLPLFGLSWHFNQKAQGIRRDLNQDPQQSETPSQRRLKWILFSVVVAFVLYAFLW